VLLIPAPTQDPAEIADHVVPITCAGVVREPPSACPSWYSVLAPQEYKKPGVVVIIFRPASCYYGQLKVKPGPAIFGYESAVTRYVPLTIAVLIFGKPLIVTNSFSINGMLLLGAG